MGWGRILLQSEAADQSEINEIERDIRYIQHDIRTTFRKDMSQDQAIKALIDQNAEIKLYLAALIRLLLANSTISKAELATIIESVDASDGKADGKYDGEIMEEGETR